MTPQKRLDQLEPLLAEHSAQLDLHTAQLHRIGHHIQQIGEAIATQSDNIGFLLREQADLKDRVIRLEAGVASLKAGVASLKAEVASLKAEIVSFKNETNQRLDRIENMVVAIYQAIQKPSGN